MRTPLPPAYVGIWRRTRIVRVSGAVDTSTSVWWFQSPRFHIDLRIPGGRPAIASPAALGQMAAAPFAAFAAQSGFAGVTVVDDARCEWQPEIAFPAVSRELDAGIMQFIGIDRLHEVGVDGSYEEDWERIAGRPCTGVRLKAVGVPGLVAFVVVGADWMALAHGSAQAAFPAMGADGTSAWSEFCVCERTAASEWRVAASNNPWREGALVALPARLREGQMVALAGHEWRVTDIAASNLHL